jgi:ribonuclease D
VPLLAPAEGVPPVVVDAGALAATVARLAGGHGPVAVDAERASGYRYSQRAYLVQLRRQGAGTALVDPIAVPDLSAVRAALADTEWVLHAASQDVACLAEVGMAPPQIFDTELAARLLNLPRVGLGPLLEDLLGVSLAKEHSAADWSTRPLPDAWLRYAALDVELLVELRDVLLAQLIATGKLGWAREEFAAVGQAPPSVPAAERWRKVSGLHRVRDRRRLAVVRALWEERDRVARSRDLAPGRVLPDAALVDAALSDVAGVEELVSLNVFRGRSQRRDAARWFAAIARGRAVGDRGLPAAAPRYDGPPPARAWADRDPVAAARLAAARVALGEVATEHDLPVENLLTPDTVRRLCWSPPAESATPDVAAATVAERLRSLGAREWQIALTAGPLAAALRVEPAT